MSWYTRCSLSHRSMRSSVKLSLSGPRPIRFLLQEVRQRPGQLGVVLAVLVQVVGEAKPLAQIPLGSRHRPL
jgi:hypothetical protein